MTKVGDIFGQNLRKLCRRDGTPSATARALGISHVQMHRYLRGESYPKPAELVKICRHFGVDARILTDLIAEGAETAPGFLDVSVQSQAQRRLLDAVRFAAPEQDLMPDHSPLRAGFYLGWASSLAYPGKVTRNLYKVQIVNGVRTVRTHDPIELFPDLIAARSGIAWRSPRQREARGAALTNKEGVSVLFVCPPPASWVSMLFLAPAPSSNGKLLTGIELFCRQEYAGVNRIARIVWDPLPSVFSALMKAARLPAWFEMDQVPPHVRSILELPVG